jgi:hypothetical protein
MKPNAYKRRRFPPDAIRRAVRLYFRLTFSPETSTNRRPGAL